MTAETAGRPRNFDPDEALDLALELFWKKGYRATTTRELEASLGLSQSSLYNTFGSKQQMLVAALDRYESQIDSTLLEPLEMSAEGLPAIEEFFRALGHWVTHDGRRGCMIINLMAEDGGETEEIRLRTRGYRHRVRRALKRALDRAARRGEIEGGMSQVRADLLFGMVLGLNIAARGGAATSEIKRLLQSARHETASWAV